MQLDTSSLPRAGPGPRETQLESAAHSPPFPAPDRGCLSPSLRFHNRTTEMVLPTPEGFPEAERLCVLITGPDGVQAQ